MEQGTDTQEKWKKKRWLLLLLAVLGVGLLFLGNVLPEGGERQAGAVGTPSEDDELQRYADALAQEIEDLCRAATGLESVHAVVSLDGGFTYVYATDNEQRQSEGSSQSSASYVTVGSGSEESPVLLSRIPPRVRGIGIVCQSGGNVSHSELISLLAAAYDIGTNKIYIIEAK